MQNPDPLAGRHIVFLSWRDTRNPEGGGAELYLERMAAGLVDRGARVTVFSAAHAAVTKDEVVDGIRWVRGGSKLTVYAHGIWSVLRRRFGHVDAFVDVQNGMPFLSRAVTRRPVIVLVHHVHREQWPVVYPGLPGRFGWWIESRLAPRLYRRCQYVAVSHATRDELSELGVDTSRIAVVHNGTEPVLPVLTGKADAPTLCTVGRLVPHKQVEHAIDAAVALRDEFPGLRLHVVGSGWWGAELERYAERRHAAATVVFDGHVDEARKQEMYARAWLLLLPSLKEGWGLVVGEAGMHGTPAVAYRSAGGVRESIADGTSGVLVDGKDALVDAVRDLLRDPERLRVLSENARAMSRTLSWDSAQEQFAVVVRAALAGDRVGSENPEAVRRPSGRSRGSDHRSAV